MRKYSGSDLGIATSDGQSFKAANVAQQRREIDLGRFEQGIGAALDQAGVFDHMVKYLYSDAEALR